MSVKHLLFQQSNVRSGLRAEITAHKRISDSYVHRRLKQRKYDLPDNWHVNFKNKCLYCQQPVDGIRGMKGHIKFCKSRIISTANDDSQEMDFYEDLSNHYYTGDGIDASFEIDSNGNNQGELVEASMYLNLQQRLLTTATRLRAGKCQLFNGDNVLANWKTYLESRRTIPLSTNTTDLRNQILQKIIFKGLHIQNTTNIEEDSESDDDQDDDLINDDNNSETDEMYEQGLDTDQFAFLTSI